MNSGPIDLLGLTASELAGILGGSGRARQVWTALRRGIDPTVPGFLGRRARSRLDNDCRVTVGRLAERRQSSCGTTKLLVALADGGAVETVVIPGRGRSTACISVQVGCARRCTFCVTATMGLRRSLSAAEIVQQVLLARAEVRTRDLPPLRNVVFMGMGEPLDNLEETRRAISVLLDPATLAVPPRHVTVSTVGPSPQVVRKARDLPVCLAWSLHAVDDELRRRLVPSARDPVAEIREAFASILSPGRRALFIEMALIADVNDGEQHAGALADFVAAFPHEVRVNLLPMNPGREPFQPSSPARVLAFQEVLRGRGLFCVVRASRGRSENAACGQLATQI